MQMRLLINLKDHKELVVFLKAFKLFAEVHNLDVHAMDCDTGESFLSLLQRNEH